jgi:D-3-phosphoglycerate dehydrogenase
MSEMATWKILVTDGLDEAGKAILRSKGEMADMPGITPEDLLKVVGEYDALIVRGRTKVTPAVFDAGTKLKVVGRAGVGVDNIDLAAAKAHGVAVVNAPLGTTVAVAELAMAMMLSLMRELPRVDASMKAGKWLKKEFEGTELFHKTLGVIGFGRIGAAVAKRAAAFDMTVLGFDPLIPGDEIAKRGGNPVTLDELLAQSDILTLHVPLTDGTRALLNEAAFTKMKKGVYIVDAARGNVLDEKALLAALDAGVVAGAALDVWQKEPCEADQAPLIAHPKVIAAPHIGAQTKEAQERASIDISEEVLNALEGKTLRWKVA